MGEQLMNGPGSARTPQLSITDSKVCRSYLAGTCPHDLFTNTKQDIGSCPKVHSEPLKAEYEAADPEQRQKWSFEYDYMRDMQKYIDECNRKIDAAQRRLEKTPDEIRQTNNLVSLFALDIVSEKEGTLRLTRDVPHAAQTDKRPLQNHKHRPARNRNPLHIRQRQPRSDGALQAAPDAADKSRPGARTQVALRHQWSLGSPETPSLRCVWRVLEPAG